MKTNNRYTWETNDLRKAKFDKILIIPSLTAKHPEHKEEDKDQAWLESKEEHSQAILTDIPYEKDWKVLDIGCGIGRMMATFSDKFKQVDGVDFSESMIEFSKDYLKDYENCNTYLNNGYDLSQLEDNSYDFVYSIITFQHISKDLVNSYIKEILRVLKDSKYISLQFMRPTLNKLPKYAGPAWRHFIGHNFENDSELLELFKDFDVHYQIDKKWAWIKGNKNELN
tara:strand:+ start:11240 stop:11917 length:678 start_codon:yes stop_codon:yes gene_type:complete